ncbi:hypothetical protein F8568_006650 [Actinomadura sp. LD22]|uniref:Galactokinase n=1 Tax=Actinomadura physcomitrii TaxID=2650748 RepID=A0A6I4M266_9ACTN|nr:hypothetical protein [Actinomadura physcomitrii]MWA00058.1 hypothetical protein [Actinomadura physcomitrii]
MIGPTTSPEIRMTAYVFERVHGSPPTAIHRALIGLPLLDGLTIAVPWGAIVAAGPSSGHSLYSVNHHTDGAASLTGPVPHWAREPAAVLNSHADPAPGTHLVINRELPAETGLLTGAETAAATFLALRALHGPPAGPHPLTGHPAYRTALHARAAHAVLTTPRTLEHIPFDLAAADLRVLIVDLGARHSSALPTPPGAAARAAAALRASGPSALGPLLTDAHTFGDPLPDRALRTALSAGALGGRKIGACVVALAPTTAVPVIRRALTTRLTPDLPRPPRLLTALPTAAAGL